jgi:hypothetical protein
MYMQELSPRTCVLFCELMGSTILKVRKSNASHPSNMNMMNFRDTFHTRQKIQ